MKRSEYFKLGAMLIIIAILVGIVPALFTLLRSTTGDDMDTTQASTDTGGALSFLGMSLPVLGLGIVMIVLGIRKEED